MTTDVTSNPDEWERVEEDWAGAEPIWQHRWSPNVYSTDGGTTYYSLDEVLGPDGNPRIHTSPFDKTELSTRVHEAVGAASVAWENMSGTGVFQEAQARKIAADLIEWVNDHYEMKENQSA